MRNRAPFGARTVQCEMALAMKISFSVVPADGSLSHFDRSRFLSCSNESPEFSSFIGQRKRTHKCSRETMLALNDIALRSITDR